jgi:hypothetical protein
VLSAGKLKPVQVKNKIEFLKHVMKVSWLVDEQLVQSRKTMVLPKMSKIRFAQKVMLFCFYTFLSFIRDGTTKYWNSM